MSNQLQYSQESKLSGYLNEGVVSELSTTSIKCVFKDSDTLDAKTPQSDTLEFVIDPQNTLKQGSEHILVSSHSTASGITTLATVTRGLTLTGYSVTGLATRAKRWAEGTPIACVTTHLNNNISTAILNGTIATGANNLRVGDETDSDIKIYAQNADTNKPYLNFNKTIRKWEYSNNGTSSAEMGTAGGALTGGDGIDITSGTIKADLATTPALEISSAKLQVKTKTPVAGYLTGGTAATAVIATWTAVSDGEFTISVDGVSQDITTIDFSSGVTTMAHVASTIQTALRLASAGGGFTLSTCTWSTDHFIITSGTTGTSSAVSVTSAVSGSGTDISGVDTTAFMDCETGKGTATAGVSGNITRDSDGVIADNINLGDIVNITSNFAEINVLDGINISNVTATNLNTLVAGVASDADALHKHTGQLIATGRGQQIHNAYGAGETIDTTITVPTGYTAGKIVIHISAKLYRAAGENHPVSYVGTAIFSGTTQSVWAGLYTKNNMSTSVTEAVYSATAINLNAYAEAHSRNITVTINSIAGGTGNDVIIRGVSTITGTPGTNASYLNLAVEVYAA